MVLGGATRRRQRMIWTLACYCAHRLSKSGTKIRSFLFRLWEWKIRLRHVTRLFTRTHIGRRNVGQSEFRKNNPSSIQQKQRRLINTKLQYSTYSTVSTRYRSENASSKQRENASSSETTKLGGRDWMTRRRNMMPIGCSPTTMVSSSCQSQAKVSYAAY